jgi:hypothetical protein
MLKNMLIRALLATAALGVVAVVPGEVRAQDRKRGGSAEKAPAEKAPATAGERTREKASSKAADSARAKAEAKAEAVAKAKSVKAATKRVEKAEAAKVDEAAQEAKAEAAAETHAKHMGKIERLEQIATATDNSELKNRVARLRELELKRHGLATNN